MSETDAKQYFLTPNLFGVSQFYQDIAQNNPQFGQRLAWLEKYKITVTPTQREGFSALHVAAQFSNLDTLKKLVDSRLFAINARDYKQRTPLHIAALAGRLDCLLFLLSIGAEESLTDQVGFTAVRLPNGSLENCYIKFTAADMRELCNEFHPNRKSKTGLPYPFKIRDLPLNKELLSDDIVAVVAQYSLTGKNPLVGKQIQTAPDVIPQLGHFVWVGSLLENPTYRENILSFKQNFPELNLIAWVSETNQDLINWAEQNDVILLDAKLIFDNNFENADFFLLDDHKGDPGSATNHLRLEILRRFGGFYFDVDVRCNRAVKIADFAKAEILLYTYFHNEEVFFNNCLVAALPHNRFIEMLLKKMAGNYFTKKFITQSAVPSGFEMRFKTRLSGPPNLQPLFALTIYGCKAVGEFDPTPFSSSSDVSWMNPGYGLQNANNTPEAAKLALKKFINSMVHELMLDPERIFFDLYEAVFKKFSEYHIARLGLHMLCTYWLPLEKVQQAILFDTALNEINYKNKYGNNDIIACSKKNLKFFRSDYMKFWEKTYKAFEPITPALVEKYFHASHIRDTLKEDVFENPDQQFAASMAQTLLPALYNHPYIYTKAAPRAVLVAVLREKDPVKIKAAILEALTLAGQEYEQSRNRQGAIAES